MLKLVSDTLGFRKLGTQELFQLLAYSDAILAFSWDIPLKILWLKFINHGILYQVSFMRVMGEELIQYSLPPQHRKTIVYPG